MIPKDLLDAYKQTSYLVKLSDGEEIAVHVGESNKEYDRLLAKDSAGEWVFITAYNPHSKKISPDENRKRHRELEKHIRASGLSYYEAQAISDNGSWDVEYGFCIIGMSREDAVKTGRQYEQNAIVYGLRGGRPELILCG